LGWADAVEPETGGMSMRRIALFCGFAFLAATVSAAAAAPTPTAVVRSFYQWYFSPSAKGHTFDHLGAAREFFTPSFYALLSRVMPYERLHGEVLEADPFIDAQIEASSVSVGSATITDGSAAVPVTVRYPRSISGGQVKVIVVKTAAGWRIDDFVGTTGGSVKSMLAHNMK
jgi:hypothetical protein